MNSPDFEAFGSTRPRGQNSAAASWQRRAGAATALEFNPHNGVHQAIGGNMSVIALSARDPIFFLHHANVDGCGPPEQARQRQQPRPDVAQFRLQWEFHRWLRFAVERQRRRAWFAGGARLRYDDDTGPFAADLVMVTGDVMTEKLQAYRRLDSRAPIVSGRVRICAGSICRPAARSTPRLPTTIRSPRATGNRNFRAARPSARRHCRGAGVAFRPDRPDAQHHRRYIWAGLRDIEPPLDGTTRVRVFVNCHELSPRTGLNDPSYATSISFFGGEHLGHVEAAGRGQVPRGDGASVYIDLRRRWPAWTIPAVSAPTGDGAASAALLQQRSQCEQYPAAAGRGRHPMSSNFARCRKDISRCGACCSARCRCSC